VTGIYTAFKQSVLQGDIDMTLVPLQAQPVSAYVFDPADTVLADITGAYGAAADVDVLNIVAGKVLVSDITFPAVTGAGPITGLVVYVAAASNPLVCFIDRRADTVPMDITPNGGDLTFSLPWLVKI
jgi:hypothetical protein